MERLQKIIANSGYCSRRKAEEFIKEGKVKVNGSVVTDLGTKASGSDVITVCGDKLMGKPVAPSSKTCIRRRTSILTSV